MMASLRVHALEQAPGRAYSVMMSSTMSSRNLAKSQCGEYSRAATSEQRAHGLQHVARGKAPAASGRGRLLLSNLSAPTLAP